MPSVIAAIQDKARTSGVGAIFWPDRGHAPRGYVEGMAVAFGRMLCKLKAQDAAALAMAAAAAGPTVDALGHYAAEFAALGMANDTAGPDPLRHLFVLMMGLGMRESSGQYCEGRDREVPESEVTADNAEAGLFQASYDLRHVDPLLPKIFAAYRAAPSGFVDIFKQGVTCSAKMLQNWGTGDGVEFQKLSKASPAFALEFAAVGLRRQPRHWGPIRTKKAQLKTECDALFKAVQAIVDATPGACAELTA